MSIVNQMLKDLDARCGPASGQQLAALQGLGLVNGARNHVQQMLMFSVFGLAAVCAVAIGYQAIGWWLDGHQPIASHPTPVITVPAVLADAPEAPSAEPEISRKAAVGSQVIEDLENDRQAAEAAPPAADRPAKVRESQSLLETAAVTKPIRHLSAQQKADQLFADAQTALSVQDFARSEVLLRQALFEFPRHHSARAQLAALLAARENQDAAERLLAQGLTGNEQEIELVRPYVQLLVARGALEPALAVLSNTMNGKAADADLFALRAAILHRLDRHSDAARAYRQALAEQPGNAVWWTGLAIAQEHDRQFQQALAAYRQAARLPMENSLRDYVNQRIQLIQNTDGQ